MKVTKKYDYFGFTIVELLVVIVVIAILAAITIISFTGISSKAIASALQSDLSNASKQLKLFQITNSNYPNSISTSCSTSTTTILCFKFSPNTSYEYIVDNSVNPQVFNLTVTNTISDTSYTVSNSTQPTLGTYQTPGIVTDGLVLNLDAGDSASYSGSGTTWTDLSGNNNHGTLMNGVGYNSSNGKALSFDGVNDYVDVGDGANFQFGTGNLTYECWIKTNKNDSDYQYVLGKSSTGPPYVGVYFYINKGKIRGYFNTTSTLELNAGNIMIADGNWHHIAYVFNRTNLATPYIDRVADLTTNISGWTTSLNNTSTLKFGSNVFVPQNFVGSISVGRVYNRALSLSEITQNFNAQKARYGL